MNDPTLYIRERDPTTSLQVSICVKVSSSLPFYWKVSRLFFIKQCSSIHFLVSKWRLFIDDALLLTGISEVDGIK